MGLILQIKEDIEDITSNLEEFSVPMTLTAPNGQTASINGFHSKHHLGFNNDLGKRINSRNAHASFSEKFLTDLSYPVRISGQVNLEGHKLTAKDSTGNDVTYVIEQYFQDETIGLIVCILGAT